MKKLIKILKDSMAEFWMLYVVAFLMGGVVGSCMTYNYLLKVQQNKLRDVINYYDKKIRGE